MLQTLDHRGRNAWPADWIVDPELRGGETPGRFRKPGLALAVDAMSNIMVIDQLSARAAARVVARKMVNWWKRFARCTGDLERLNSQTLAAQLRIAHHRRLRNAEDPGDRQKRTLSGSEFSEAAQHRPLTKTSPPR